MNIGLAGLVSFIPTQGDVFSVQGGNGMIPFSAFHQAKATHAAKCVDSQNDNGKGKISHTRATVSSVICTNDGIEVWDKETKLGVFDYIFIAAPLQQSQISFLTRNRVGGKDQLQALHFDRIISFRQRHTSEHTDRGQGDQSPSSTTRRYTQTVTTMVRNATLSHGHFHLHQEDMPRAISVTVKGKENEGISAIAQLTATGLFKVFSSEPLSHDALSTFFGPYHQVEYVKVWGGQHGGAYPDFDGGGEATHSAPFQLHGAGRSSGSSAKSIYYINAIEASVAAMEISAIGAKAVAKLASQKLEL